MKEKFKYLKTVVPFLFLSLIFSGFFSQPVHADIVVSDVDRSDVAGAGTIVMDLLPTLILIGVIIAVIWVVSFVVIKKIKKKNGHDNK